MSSVPSVPPPIYSQTEVIDRVSDDENDDSNSLQSEAQLLISPSGNAPRFQIGFLGANDERAAIEGEVQIKGVPLDSWDNLTLSMHSTESTDEAHIDLNSLTIVLYSRSSASSPSSSRAATVPSSIPFSIPLMSDTPQCFHFGHSSLVHTLSATLRTLDANATPLSRTITVHTRRYSPHSLSCEIVPHSLTLHNPTKVDVQIPRTVFRMDEPIPVYVTIPPPDRSFVLEQGFSLRSVRAELIRTVKLLDNSLLHQNRFEEPEDVTESDAEPDDIASSSGVPPSPPSASFSPEKGSTSQAVSSSDVPEGASNSESPYESVIARSGSSCRFHSSRPIKLRLLLHGSSLHSTPDGSTSQIADGSFDNIDNDANCASITQMTLMHSIEFRVQVRVTFLHSSTHSEQTFPLIFPITILPPPAQLPEVDPSLDSAYRKKHDRPPLRTVRREDSDLFHDQENANQPGPSVLASGAPPPFDDIPPPFTSHAEASSSRLPTFTESETEIYVPSNEQSAFNEGTLPPGSNDNTIAGEGVLFGFPQSEQYDGYSCDIIRSSTPPPTVEMALDDPDVTGLADLVNQPDHAIDALNMVIDEASEQVDNRDLLPPPPPPLDDPSDPPPSIDTEFRYRTMQPPAEFGDPELVGPLSGSQSISLSQIHSSPPEFTPNAADSVVQGETTASPLHAPPPYLNPIPQSDHEHATGPPPYVDLVPGRREN